MAGGLGSRVQDFLLEVAKGNVAGHYTVNKFGRNIEIDAATIADIWDGGQATGGVSLIWVAPTQARVHQLVSSSTDDAAAGVGARTVEVFYLPDWDTKETSIIVSMNGTSNVALPSLVIINRMSVVSKGATSSNVGIIKATADSDSTITSQIRALQGQTQQLIFGVPSTQVFYLSNICAYLNKTGGAAGLVDFDILVNPEPASELTNFLSHHPWGLQTVGTSSMLRLFPVFNKIVGAAIIKVQAASSTNNMNISAGFDGILVDNVIGAL